MFRREMTDQRVHRRQLIQLFGVGAAAALAGCDYPKNRFIGLRDIGVEEKRSNETVLGMQVIRGRPVAPMSG